MHFFFFFFIKGAKSFIIQKTKDFCAVKHNNALRSWILQELFSYWIKSTFLWMSSPICTHGWITSMSICNSCVLYVFMIEQKNLSERSNKRVTPWFIITLKEVLSPLSLHPHLHTLLVMGTCVAHNCTHLCYYIQDTSSWDSEVITPTSMIVTWEGKKIFQDLIVL